MTGPPEPETPAVWPPSPVGFDAPAPVKPRRELLTGNRWLDEILAVFGPTFLALFVRDTAASWFSKPSFLLSGAVPRRLTELFVAACFVVASFFVSHITRPRFPFLARGLLTSGIVQIIGCFFDLSKGRI